ncbi:DUF99 family protein [Candidatus Pacearchaeota archaeon]|nr:DUF99 family protein [Candidatus Pacearchaeota archaeon]
MIIKVSRKKTKGKNVKLEIRIVGIDDAPFEKFFENRCLVVATVFRGGNYMDGLLSCHVKVDGSDATEKLVKLIKKTRHYGQINCIMLNGIAVAGFNIIDIGELSEKTGIPVVVIIRKMPDMNKIAKAIDKASDSGITADRKMNLIAKAAKIHKINIQGRNLFIQIAGVSLTAAAKIVRISATHSLIPEPLRIAHIIASGIKNGESHGRA